MEEILEHPDAQKHRRDGGKQEVKTPADFPGLSQGDDKARQQQSAVADEIENENGAGGEEIGIREDSAGKAEHLLVQIVGNRAEDQRRRRGDHDPRPAGQGPIRRPKGCQRTQEQQQGGQEIGDIIAVPAIAFQQGRPRQIAPEDLQGQEQQQGGDHPQDQAAQPPVRDAGPHAHGPKQEHGPADQKGEAVQHRGIRIRDAQKTAEQEGSHKEQGGGQKPVVFHCRASFSPRFVYYTTFLLKCTNEKRKSEKGIKNYHF